MKAHLIAVAGGSGSGKTWFAGQLLESFGARAGRISLDDFYCDQSHVPPAERDRINFDHPSAIDWPLFERTLAMIGRGEPAWLPIYDFATHTRRVEAREWQPRSLVFLDGLWLLRRAALRRRYRLSIFIDCPEAVRRERRLRRDLCERGRSAASVAAQFDQHVAPMHRRFVAPQIRLADLVLASPVARTEAQSVVTRCRELLKAQNLK